MSEAPTQAPAHAESDEELQALLAPLEGLGTRPVADHVAAYEEVHAGLRRVLARESADAQA